MIRSKICGVSDLATLKYIINHNYPPQFIGFICNYSKSKRYVNFDKLLKLINVDKKNISLDNWNQFEISNPDTFASMYQFWVRKIK